MNCCNANGDCTQGRDCPIRKQRIKDVNDAYIRGNETMDETIIETFSELKSLMALLVFIVGIAMLAFAIWGKP